LPVPERGKAKFCARLKERLEKVVASCGGFTGGIPQLHRLNEWKVNVMRRRGQFPTSLKLLWLGYPIFNGRKKILVPIGG